MARYMTLRQVTRKAEQDLDALDRSQYIFLSKALMTFMRYQHKQGKSFRNYTDTIPNYFETLLEYKKIILSWINERFKVEP